MKKTRSLTLSVFLVLLIGLIGQTRMVYSQESDDTLWSSQAPIPNYKILTENPPLLIADQNQTVHAFNTQPLSLSESDGEEAIFYRQWRAGEGWRLPVDIIVNPGGGQIALQGVFLDKNYVVHMLYQQNFSQLYYTRVSLIKAGNAGAWSRPQLIATSVQAVRGNLPYPAGISGDGDNHLLVVYGGWSEGSGTYSVESRDGGSSWDREQVLFLNSDEDHIPGDMNIRYGDSGRVHAIWSNYLPSGFGASVYYAHFDFEKDAWSVPKDLEIQGRHPAVIEYNDLVIAVSFDYEEARANLWRLSDDFGKTWGRKSRLSENIIGQNGEVSFVIDSGNTLHAFYGGRINELSHGLWHSVFRNGSWVPMEHVTSGPQRRSVPGGNGFDPGWPRAVVVNGNFLFVTWGSDGEVGLNGAWYSYATLNTPQQPVLALPTETIPQNISATATAAVTISGSPDQDAPPEAENADDEANLSQNNLFPVLVGVIPTIVVIALGILIHQKIIIISFRK